MNRASERRVYFALAERLSCTVEELLGKISSEEISEWMAYYKVLAFEQEQETARLKKKASVRK